MPNLEVELLGTDRIAYSAASKDPEIRGVVYTVCWVGKNGQKGALSFTRDTTEHPALSQWGMQR